MNIPLNKLQDGLKEIDFNTFQNIEGLELLNSNPKNTVVIKNYKRYQNRFKQGYNKEGEYISFVEGNYSYEKLSLGINLYTPEDMNEKRKTRLSDRRDLSKKTLETLQERGKKQRSGLSVFINGKKIKDSEVQISVFNGSTDVYIKSLLFDNEEDNNIEICVENYDKHFHYISKEVTDYTNPILIPKDYIDEVVVYSEGKVLSSDKIRVSMIQNFIAFYFDETIKDIEVRTMGKAALIKEEVLERNIIQIEGYSQPLSSKILDVYVDGIKLNSDDVTVLANNMFLIDSEKYGSANLNVYYRLQWNEFETIDNVDFDNTYNKISRFLNFDKIKDILLDNKTYEGIPSFYTLENMLNEFPNKYYGNVDPMNMQDTLENAIYKIIKSYVGEDSHYLKLFLNQFLIPERNYRYKYPRKALMERIDTQKEITTRRITSFKEVRVVYPFSCDFDNMQVLVKKNKKLVNPNDFIVVRRPNTDFYFVYVSANIIKDNDEIEINIKKKTRDLEYKTQSLVDGTKSYIFEKPSYDNVEDLEIAVLPKDKNTFRMVDKSKYNIWEAEDGTHVTLSIDETLYSKIVLFNPFYSNRRIFVVNSDDPMINTVLPLAFNTVDGINYPLFSANSYKGNLEVYCAGQELIEGKDFKILEPRTDNDNEDIEIMLTFTPNKGDIIEIYITEYKEDIIVNIDKIDSANGLVYLPDLDYPFSLKYLTVYLNGKELTEDNIEVIADNFIKLKNVNSLSNFFIKEKLILDNMTILDLTNIIKRKINTFEHFIEKEIVENKQNVDEWFNDLIEQDVVCPEIDKNPIEDTEEDYVNERFDLGLHKLAVALINGDISRRIDANKNVDNLVTNDFYKYFVTDEISIDCNQNNIRVDCIIDPNELYLTREEIGNIYAQELLDGTFEVDNDGNVQDDDPIFDYIYPENEIVIDANADYDTVIALDANAYI